MKVIVLFVILFCSGSGYGQTVKIQNIRLCNVRKSVTHYGNKVVYTEANTTYDDVLANPKIVCDVPGCEVSHFIITTLVPPARDLYGPFSTDGAEVKEQVMTWIKDKKDRKELATIVVEDIEVTCNGRKEQPKGTLIYHCK